MRSVYAFPDANRFRRLKQSVQHFCAQYVMLFLIECSEQAMEPAQAMQIPRI